jgi:hypothetical protein
MCRRVGLVWTDVSEERRSAAICSCWFLARGFFHPEDGDDTFLWNVISHKIKICTTPRPRRQDSSSEVAVSNPVNIYLRFIPLPLEFSFYLFLLLRTDVAIIFRPNSLHVSCLIAPRHSYVVAIVILYYGILLCNWTVCFGAEMS